MHLQSRGTEQWKPIPTSRTCPKISHIFFADELLFFWETSFSQARLVEKLLAKFYGISGQRVTRGKSQI